MSNYFAIEDIDFIILLYLSDILDDLLYEDVYYDLDHFDTEFWYSD